MYDGDVVHFTVAIIHMASDAFVTKHFIDRKTGKAYRTYTYKRRKCVRVQLTSRLAEQFAGYTLIEKDLRNVLAWLEAIEERHNEGPLKKGDTHASAKDRSNYTLIKGLFVALLTFYGKCFSKCEGRPVKLERAQLDPRYHRLHDECMEYRHNFAAHSGAKKIEHVEVALVYPEKYGTQVSFKLFRELHQPDLFWPKPGEVALKELVEHVRTIAINKIDKLAEKITNEEIIPNAKTYWLMK